MGSSNMNGWVSKWVKKNYPIAKSDLCTCFFNRAQQLAKDDGYISMITASSWMFISSFEKFRKQLLSEGSICSMIQQSTHGYAGVTVPTTMFTYACHRMGVIGSYIRLEDFDRPQWQEPRALEALADPDCGWFYRVDADGFGVIPGSPIAYWISKKAANLFSGKNIADYGFAGIGMRTGDNSRFLRYWHEIAGSKMGLGVVSAESQILSGSKWIPYNKGGDFRKWYGNNEYVVNWFNDGEEIKANTRATYPELGDDLGWKISNEKYYYNPGITWTGVTSGAFHCRCYGTGFIFDSGANGLFPLDKQLRYYLAGLLNTGMANDFLKVLNPTINCGAGTLRLVPVILDDSKRDLVSFIVEENVQESKTDWDSFETSWDFKRHPLV